MCGKERRVYQNVRRLSRPYCNAVTKVPAYPMKDMQELVFTAGTAKWLSCLDLLRGYYQIKMQEESKPLTAFSTHNGVYQWKVMPFGLSGASGTFQRVMDYVLRKHSDYAHSYIDDIIIFSESWEQHLKHLNFVLSDLEMFGLSGKLKISSFAPSETKFIEHKIGRGKHFPNNDKILPIKHLKRPVSKKDVKSVLELMGFCKSYFPDYAEIVIPLKLNWLKVENPGKYFGEKMKRNSFKSSKTP